MRTKISILSLVLYLYIVVVGTILHILTVPEFYKSLFAQIGLIAIPYLVGRPFFYLIKKSLKSEDYKDGDCVVNSIVIWSLGVVFIMLLEIFLYVNYLFDIKYFVIILLIISTFSIFIRFFEEDCSILSKNFKYISPLIVYSLLFALFITNYWNYPYANENDYIRHAFYTSQIVELNRPLIFYSPYLPTMHTLYAIQATIFNVKNMLYLLWSSRFLLYPLFSVGIFLFSYAFSKNIWIALFSGLTGTSLTYNIEGSLFPSHTAPKNFISLLFPYVLYIGINMYTKKLRLANMWESIKLLLSCLISVFVTFFVLFFTKANGVIGYEIGYILMIFFISIVIIPIILKRFFNIKFQYTFFTLTILGITLIFIHKTNGFFSFVFLSIFLLLSIFYTSIDIKYGKLFSLIIYLCTIIIYSVFHFKILNYPEKPILSLPSVSLFLFGWQNIINYIKDIYPDILLVLFVLAIIYSIITEYDMLYFVFASIASLLMILYFSPIYASYRFLIYLHPLIIFFSTYIIFKILKINMNSAKKSYIMLFLVFFSIGLHIYLHDMKNLEKSAVIKKQEITQVFEIGEYLNKIKNKKDSIVIGEQGGMGWYQGISSFYAGIWPIYLWDGDIYRRDLIENIYLANTSQQAYFLIKNLLENKKRIISYPDNKYIEIERFYNKPKKVFILYDEMQASWLGDVNSVYKFGDPKYFKLLFITKNMRNATFYVFKMNKKPNMNVQILVNNPSFEEGLNSSSKGPVYWEKRNIFWRGILDNTSKIDGNYSYRLETGEYEGWSNVWSNEIEVNEGELYFLKFYIKTINSKRTHVKIIYWDEKSQRWKDLYYILIKSNNLDWEPFYRIIKIPKGVKRIRIALMAGSVYKYKNGKAITWFDDIEFVKIR